eukprot:scaffold111308_cov31-Prasinocladus_malaysianus.AAC.1
MAQVEQLAAEVATSETKVPQARLQSLKTNTGINKRSLDRLRNFHERFGNAAFKSSQLQDERLRFIGLPSEYGRVPKKIYLASAQSIGTTKPMSGWIYEDIWHYTDGVFHAATAARGDQIPTEGRLTRLTSMRPTASMKTNMSEYRVCCNCGASATMRIGWSSLCLHGEHHRRSQIFISSTPLMLYLPCRSTHAVLGQRFTNEILLDQHLGLVQRYPAYNTYEGFMSASLRVEAHERFSHVHVN